MGGSLFQPGLRFPQVGMPGSGIKDADNGALADGVTLVQRVGNHQPRCLRPDFHLSHRLGLPAYCHPCIDLPGTGLQGHHVHGVVGTFICRAGRARQQIRLAVLLPGRCHGRAPIRWRATIDLTPGKGKNRLPLDHECIERGSHDDCCQDRSYSHRVSSQSVSWRRDVRAEIMTPLLSYRIRSTNKKTHVGQDNIGIQFTIPSSRPTASARS